MFKRKRMDLNKINEKYGALIEDLDFMTFGICDRLLPYPKEDIETALLAQAIYHKNKKQQHMLNVVTLCYMNLPLFIPYDKYNVIKIIYAPNGFEELSKANKGVKDKFMAIQDEISADMLKRTEKLIELTAIFEPGVTNLEVARKKTVEEFRARVFNLKMQERSE